MPIRILLQVFQDTALELVDFVVPQALNLRDCLLTPNAPRAVQQQLLVLRERMSFKIPLKIAKFLDLRIDRSLEYPDLGLIVITRIDDHNIGVCGDHLVPLFRREVRAFRFLR
jgi:hypothetical protein